MSATACRCGQPATRVWEWKASVTKHRDGMGSATHHATIYEADNPADGVVCRLTERGSEEPSIAFCERVGLIAAAPDLLAALREWQAFRDSPSVLQGTSHAAHMALCEFTNKVNAAIAKAEGGAR